jgi:hypothetical protein
MFVLNAFALAGKAVQTSAFRGLIGIANCGPVRATEIHNARRAPMGSTHALLIERHEQTTRDLTASLSLCAMRLANSD